MSRLSFKALLIDPARTTLNYLCSRHVLLFFSLLLLPVVVSCLAFVCSSSQLLPTEVRFALANLLFAATFDQPIH